MTQRRPEPITTPVLYAGAQTFAVLQLLYGIAWGVATITGPDQWTSPVYTYALQVPGAPPSWGYVVLALSLVGLLGIAIHRRILIRLAFGGCTLWSSYFTVCLMRGIVESHGPTGGIVTWIFHTLLYAVVLVSQARRFAS